jgi:phosphatidate cytidylyltransferase
MTALQEASAVIAAGATLGMIGAGTHALAHRQSAGGELGRTMLHRAASYVGLAAILLVAAWAGVAGIAVLMAALGAIGLLEWCDLFDLPGHHRVGLLVADVAIMGSIATNGVARTPVLVGGLVLVGSLWPVVRSDTGRAIRDLGLAAVGCLLIPVLLVHAVALRVERAEDGAALVIALAVTCALSDVGAYLVGRRFGRHPLAPTLSPHKTVEGVIGNVIGALLGMGLFAPCLVPTFGAGYIVLLGPLVAAGSVWGDLLESAVKREAGVKDAGAWLPGFGGILDRIDSFMITVALAYWAAWILLGPAG